MGVGMAKDRYSGVLRKQAEIESLALDHGVLVPDHFNFDRTGAVWEAGDFVLPAVNGGQAMDLLDDLGVDYVSNVLANGNLPSQAARRFGVSPLALTEWLTNRLDRQQMDNLLRAMAEAFQEKSVLALASRVQCREEAALVKALSDRLASIAEGLDPDRWRSKPSTAGASAPVVNISIEGVSVGGSTHDADAITAPADPTTGTDEPPALPDRSAIPDAIVLDAEPAEQDRATPARPHPDNA